MAHDLQEALESAMAAEVIAVAAIRWQQSRALVRTLRAQRNLLLCERAETASQLDIEDAMGDALDAGALVIPQPTQEAPCWKNWQSGAEDVDIAPVAEWCASCQERHAVNEKLKAESRQHGARMRAVLHLARHRAALFVPFTESR